MVIFHGKMLVHQRVHLEHSGQIPDAIFMYFRSKRKALPTFFFDIDSNGEHRLNPGLLDEKFQGAKLAELVDIIPVCIGIVHNNVNCTAFTTIYNNVIIMYDTYIYIYVYI